MRRFCFFCLLLALSAHALAGPTSRTSDAAITPTAVNGPDWKKHHESILKQVASNKDSQLIFVGDSITDFWQNFPSFKDNYGKYNALDLGISGDKTENVLWRLDNGEIDGLHPKVAVVMIGTNNVLVDKPEWTAAGVAKIVQTLHQKLPKTKILLLAIFPRDDKNSRMRKTNDQVNELLAKLADDSTKYLDIGKSFLDDKGEISKTIMSDLVHPTKMGYDIWATAMNPTLAELMK